MMGEDKGAVTLVVEVWSRRGLWEVDVDVEDCRRESDRTFECE
jgi:hypothetical protein